MPSLGALLPAIASAITAIISAGGYAGIAALMALESACIPIPSEVIMPFAGYLVSTGRFNLWLVATAGALGCNIGSAVAYWVGAWGGRPLIVRWGRFVLLSPASIDQAERFFERFGPAAVFTGRLLPVVRTFIALPAGIGRMNQVRFHLYTFAGSWIWCVVLAYVGEQLGNRWDTDPALRSFMHRFDLVVLGLLAVAVVAFVWHHLRRRA